MTSLQRKVQALEKKFSAAAARCEVKDARNELLVYALAKLLPEQLQLLKKIKEEQRRPASDEERAAAADAMALTEEDARQAGFASFAAFERWYKRKKSQLGRSFETVVPLPKNRKPFPSPPPPEPPDPACNTSPATPLPASSEDHGKP